MLTDDFKWWGQQIKFKEGFHQCAYPNCLKLISNRILMCKEGEHVIFDSAPIKLLPFIKGDL